MGFPNIIAGPADLFHYKRNANTLAVGSQLTSGEVTSAAENPDSGIDGADRFAGSTAYNVAVVYYGALDQGGLACTVPAANYSYNTGVGHNAIRVATTVPAYTLAIGLLIDDSLVAVSATPLSVRNGNSGTAQVVGYYKPSAKAPTRAYITSQMTGKTVYGFDRLNFAETTGDTTLNLTPTTIQIERNAGSDISFVTGLTANLTANLLASGKRDFADLLNGICTKAGGLKTKQETVIGTRGLGSLSARPIEIVGPGETVGKEDSILIFSALKLSDQAISKNWSKNNPSQLPLSFVSADDELMKGVHGTLAYFEN